HRNKMSDGDAPIERMRVISILVHLDVIDRRQDIALLNAGCRGGTEGIHVADEYAAIVGLEVKVTSKLRITRGTERKSSPWKPGIFLFLSTLKEPSDDGHGNGVHALTLRVITHHDAGELAVLH